ncbi:MAG: hypothetical protein D3924_07235 [Candidatus Electrothrix sp. AR4]|nr:hypothetical protein [Candidatus Electrothrix sp. AR4]
MYFGQEVVQFMYRKCVFLYINRLSCIGKQLFVYMRGSTGITEAFFKESLKGFFRWALLPTKKIKTRQSVGNTVGNKKRELTEKSLTP